MDMDARNIEKQLDIELERCERSSRLLLKVMRTKTLARGLSLSLRLSLSLSLCCYVHVCIHSGLDHALCVASECCSFAVACACTFDFASYLA